MGRLVVFSDYDGTIDDEYTGDCSHALESIHLLKQENIPLVLVSSKTFEEMESISTRLKLDAPFAFENGAAIAYPSGNGYRIEEIGKPVHEFRAIISFIESYLHEKIETIEEMDVADLCAYAGLSREQALLAKKRRYSLPFVITGDRSLKLEDENDSLFKILQEKGFRLYWGGRFYQLVAHGAGKGEAVRRVCEFLASDGKGEIVSAGIGNSKNDFEMLSRVHHPFLVRNRNSTIDYSTVQYPVTERPGPEGFSEAVEIIIAHVRSGTQTW